MVKSNRRREIFFLLKVDLGQGVLAFLTPPWDHSTGSPGQRQYVGVDTCLQMGKLEQRGKVTFSKSQYHLVLTQ